MLRGAGVESEGIWKICYVQVRSS